MWLGRNNKNKKICESNADKNSIKNAISVKYGFFSIVCLYSFKTKEPQILWDAALNWVVEKKISVLSYRRKCIAV